MAYTSKERNPPLAWPQFKARAKHGLLVPIYYLNWRADWAAYLLAKWPLTALLEYLGSFSILFAVVFYFAGAPDRLKQKHYQAWQVINTAAGKGGNGGRIDALRDLNEDHMALIGVDVADAYLEGLQLEKAQARRSNFSGTDLRRARFKSADLDQADFHWANLRGADLSECNLADSQFDDADLVGASLAQANLAGISLQRADLRGADLNQVKNWQQIKAISQANLFGVKNAPDGFVTWAKTMGAIEAK